MLDANNTSNNQELEEDVLTNEEYMSAIESSNEHFFEFIGHVSLELAHKYTEIRKAYRILQKPIDPKKLLTDASYRDEISKSITIVKKHDRKKLNDKGVSKYETILPKAEAALKQANLYEEARKQLTSRSVVNYASSLKKTYNLSDTDFDQVIDQTQHRINSQPNLSMQEALRYEAEAVELSKMNPQDINNARKSTQNELASKKLSREKYSEELNRISHEKLGLEEKKRVFNEQTSHVHQQDIKSGETLYTIHLEQTNSILGNFQTREGMLNDSPSISPITPTPTLREMFPGSTPQLQAWKQNRSKLISNFTLPTSVQPVQSAMSFMSKALSTRMMKGLGNVVKNSISAGKALLNRAFNMALNFLPAGVGLAIKAGLKLWNWFNKMTNGLLNGLLFDTAKYIFILIILIPIIAPMIISTLFSSSTQYYPFPNAESLTEDVNVIKISEWNTFQQSFLKTKGASEIHLNAWNQFNVQYLSVKKEYLTSVP